ncbi:MAG: hypothetical protein JW776_16605 [Candidatus Lokiarchaeota archaeon]|nr:hypothetical protein [Candidatus Lokiarchaeota archaeon]
MKKDQYTLAYINLNAVIKSIVHLYELDKEIKDLVGDRNIAIQFIVRKGPSALLKFENGKCTFLEGRHKNDVLLFFVSPIHFNNMINGKSNPIPLKGFIKLGFLTKEFNTITKKLEYYLRPTRDLLENENYAKINTILAFYTAFNALCQVANTDEVGKYTAKRLSDGNALATIGTSEKVYIEVKKHTLKTYIGEPEKVHARMEFVDYETASGMLNDTVDAYSCIGSKRLKLSGYIPLLEDLNALLYQTSMYLKEDT